MANNNQMTFSIGIKTNYDAEGIKRLQSDLTKLQDNASKNMNFFGDTSKMQESLKAAQQLKLALSEAYNPKLGTLTIDRFNQSLKKSGTTLKELQVGMHNFGSAGDIAFSNASIDLLKMNNIAKSSTTLFDKMFNTFKNTITWGLSSALWNNITGSIQKSYYYIKDLDEALNDIRIVTSKSNEEMEKFAINANNAAKALAVSTEDYTQGALIYYQQGLSDEEVKRRTDITAKTSNVTGQSMSAVSEQLTAVWNGYKVSAAEAELYVDRLAAVAATTASDLEELSTGMSKVASSAAALGVSEEQLSAMLATTISVTRQAPESVGTAYKTIFARISDIEAGLDAETSLGNYTQKMANMGVTVLDASGKLRDMGEVIEEIGSKWATMSREQQISLAQTMAGTRQYNNLVALFDNWSSYADTLQVAANAEGTLDKQQAIAMDSIKNRLDVLKSTWEDFYQNLFDSEDIKEAISGLTKLVQLLADFTEAVGGLKTMLPGILSIILQIGSVRIGSELGHYINSLQSMNGVLQQSEEAFRKFKDEMLASSDANAGNISEAQAERLKEVYSRYEQIIDKKKYMNAQDKDNLNLLLEQEKEVTALKIKAEEYQNIMSAKHVNLVDMKYNIGPKEFNTYGLIKQMQSQPFDFSSSEKSISELDRIRGSLLAVGAAIEDVRNNSDGVEVLKQNLQDLVKTDPSIAKLITRLENLAKKNNETVAINKFSKEIETATNKVNNMSQTLRDCEYQERATNEAFKEFGKSFDLSIMITQFTQFTSVITGVTSAINSLVNITNIWKNDSLTDGQKLLQIVTAIGFAITALSNPMLKTIDFIKSLKTTFATIKELKVANLIESEKEAVLEGKITVQKLKQTKELEKQALLKKQQNIEDAINLKKYANMGMIDPAELNSRMAMIDPSFVGKNNNQLGGMKSQVNQQINSIDNDINDLNSSPKAGTGLVGFIASNPVAAGVIAGTILAIAAALGVLYAVEKKREGLLKKANENLEDIKKEAEELEERNKKLQDAATAYEGLRTQLKEGKITEQEFRNQALQLTDSLEDQALKAELLAGQYDNLSNSLEKAQKKQNDMLMAQYQNEQEAASASMEAGWNKGSNFWADIQKFTGSLTWQSAAENLFGGSHAIRSIAASIDAAGTDEIRIAAGQAGSGANKAIAESMKKALGDKASTYYDGKGYDVGFNLQKIETDEDRKYVYEAIQEVLKDQSQYSESWEYKQLKQIADNMQQGYDANKEAEDKIKEIGKNNLILEVNKENIKSKSDFEKEVNELTSRAIKQNLFDGENAYNDARIWAISELQGISDEANQWAKDNSLISLILENSNSKDTDKKQLAKNLEEMNLSSAKLTYLSNVAGAIGEDISKETLQGMIDGASSAIKYIEAKNLQLDVQAAISIANTNHSFDAEGIKAIFAEGLEGINEAKFFEAGYAEQMQTMIIASTEAQQKIIDEGLSQKAIDEAKATIASLEEQRGSLFRFNASNINLSDDKGFSYEFEKSEIDENNLNLIRVQNDENGTIKSTEEVLKGLSSQEDVLNYLNDYVDAKAEGKEIEEENYQILVDAGIVREEEIKQLIEDKKAYNDFTQQIEGTYSWMSTLTEEQVNYAEKAKQAADVMDYYNTLVDNLQSGYKTLSTAVTEWNDNQGFSADTLQSLMNMSPEYIDCLELEGDNFKINKEKTEEYTKSLLLNQLAMMEQTRIEQYMDIAQRGTKSDFYSLIMATDLATASTASFIEQQRQLALAAIESSTALNEQQKETMKLKLTQQFAYDDKLKTGIEKSSLSTLMGGSSSKSSKDQKNYFNEFDRYWELKKNLEIITNAIKKLDEAEKNLYGKQKIDSLKNKNQLLNQQADAYKALYEEQKKEQAELVGSLQGMGVGFDADGNITNYVAKTSEELDKYNKAVADYNSGKMSKKAFEKAEDDYKNFKDYLERYDKLYYTEMKDTLDNLQEITRQQMENNLEAWQIEVDLKIDWQELERQWNDFIAGISKDITLQFEDLDIDFDTAKTNYESYIGENGTLSVRQQQANDVQTEIDKILSGEGSDKFESLSQAQEKLKEINSSLMSEADAAKAAYESMYNAMLNKIKQYGDKLDQQLKKYDVIDAKLNHQKQLIGLLYGDKAYGMMDSYYKAQEKNSLSRIESLKSTADTYEELYKNAAEGSKEQQLYYDKWIESQQKLNDETENYIKLLQEDYINALKKAQQEYENYLTNGKGFDIVKAEWDDLKEYSNNYFDNIESKYQISALGSKIQQGIDSQDSLAARQKLQALYDREIAQLKEKEELTQYDLDAAEQRYNIALKEIALEDAQNTKNSMKVTRDTNGNWTYQYVADTSDVEEKKQELSDEIYKLYEMSKDAYQENIDNMISLQENYEKSIYDIQAELMELANATDEDSVRRKEVLNAELNRITEQYYRDYEILARKNAQIKDDLEVASAGVLLDSVENGKIAYDELSEHEKTVVDDAKEANISSYEELDEAVKDTNAEMKEDTSKMLEEEQEIFSTTAEDMANKWNADDGESVKAQQNAALDTMYEKLLEYQNNVHTVATAVEEDFGEGGIKGSLDDATQSVEDIHEAINDLCDDANSDLPDMADAVYKIKTNWDGVKTSTIDAIGKIKEYLQKTQELANVKVTTSFGSVGNDNQLYNETGGGDVTKDPPADTTTGWYIDKDNGQMKIIVKSNDKKVTDIPLDEKGQAYTSVQSQYMNYKYVGGGSYTNKDIDKGLTISDYFKKVKTIKFDTGGYTGEWNGGDGRLAMLHSKELVLNATDTQNILSAVDAIRQISSVGSSITSSIANGIASLINGVGGIPNIINGGNSSSKQNVFNIEASFPNAANVDEIQQAILSLPNLASQYIARTSL